MAAKAFRRGDKKTAKREANEGKRYKQLYLYEKRSVVERTLASKNSYLNRNQSIDLHGLHESEVEDVLDQYIYGIREKISTGEIASNRGNHRGHCVTIITGKGNNSRNFTPVGFIEKFSISAYFHNYLCQKVPLVLLKQILH